MTESEIIYNYNRAISKADELDKIANDIESSVFEGFDGTIQKIDKVWDGVNSMEYLQKCKEEQRNIEKIIKRIRSAASAIREIAENARCAEGIALKFVNTIDRIVDYFQGLYYDGLRLFNSNFYVETQGLFSGEREFEEYGNILNGHVGSLDFISDIGMSEKKINEYLLDISIKVQAEAERCNALAEALYKIGEAYETAESIIISG